jgi:hypothetical protein
LLAAVPDHCAGVELFGCSSATHIVASRWVGQGRVRLRVRRTAVIKNEPNATTKSCEPLWRVVPLACAREANGKSRWLASQCRTRDRAAVQEPILDYLPAGVSRDDDVRLWLLNCIPICSSWMKRPPLQQDTTVRRVSVRAVQRFQGGVEAMECARPLKATARARDRCGAARRGNRQQARENRLRVVNRLLARRFFHLVQRFQLSGVGPVALVVVAGRIREQDSPASWYRRHRL